MEREPVEKQRGSQPSNGREEPYNAHETHEEPLSDSASHRSRSLKRLCALAQVIFAWAFGVLVLLFIFFITFGTLYSAVRYGRAGTTQGQKCPCPFGVLLGVHNGIFAYSNCGASKQAQGQSNATVNTAKDSYGVQWQCVEYARRYWMLRGKPQPAAFGSVDGAADIWDLTDVQLLGGGRRPLLRYFNGNESAAGSGPRVGDLLIYPRQPGGFPYGHVAVVAGVTEDRLYVAEQNWDNLLWPGPDHNYSRAVKLSCSSRGAGCTVHDSGNITLLGWVRY